ncbi:MAG: gamma-glutamyltransferase [Gammaproteobacteria bacterium]|nr:gamma-glutamyltransferase [Gammaproteobacteria bacterium]
MRHATHHEREAAPAHPTSPATGSDDGTSRPHRTSATVSGPLPARAGTGRLLHAALLTLCLLSLSFPTPAQSPAQPPAQSEITRTARRDGASQAAIYSARDLSHPVASRYGMVASQEATATRVGVAVLESGGNAVDAAVAVGFALAVTLPRAGNVGGGGFMLVHDAGTATQHAIDYRERAPTASSRDMYLGEDGEVDRHRKRFSHLSVGVPGTVAGLHLAHQRFGSRPWTELIAPAIALARDGIVVGEGLAAALQAGQERLAAHPASARIFLRPDGKPWQVGERLVQSDLADSLEAIARQGPQAFYEGHIAKAIAEEMRSHGGLITRTDLAAYSAVLRAPVRGRYRGHEIVSMPPPSSGGVHLIQILNILEGFDLTAAGHNSAQSIHWLAESMKRAYADRSAHLGDPDHWPVPVTGLTDERYAARLRADIDARATASSQIRPGTPQDFESEQTTHYSIMDRTGNVVSNTYTLNFSFGSGIVAPGTGILLNNEMDDFSGKPGTANAYGLIGGEANAVQPGKRPLSSMTPTIVLRGGEPLLATGSPGGSRIITTVLQVISNIIDHGMNLQEATNAPRVHHQWLPDELRVEEGLSIDTIRLLRGRGHEVVVKNAMGSTQSVQHLRGIFLGASDPRRRGALSAGPATLPSATVTSSAEAASGRH